MSRSDGGAGFFPEVRKPSVKRAHGGGGCRLQRAKRPLKGSNDLFEMRRQGLARRPLGLNVPGRRIFRRAPGRPKVLCETAKGDALTRP